MFPHHIRHRKRHAPPPPNRGGGAGFVLRVTGYVVLIIGVGFAALAYAPGIPDQYNPISPFDPATPPGPFTGYKLNRATATPAQCFAELDKIPDLRVVRMLDREVSDQCHIREHTRVRGLWGAGLAPVSTRCSIALRLYMWERHSLQPAAATHLGRNVVEIEHLSSYSCRKLRTPTGDSDRMSAHATASAIDINGVVLTDGTRLRLTTGWDSPDPDERRFWRALRNGACDWFHTVLSPDYNALHADHFHLAQGAFRACR